MLDQGGHANLHDFLRTSYADGSDLETMARSTGLGRSRLRREIEAAGITVRAAGHNTAEAKRARAKANDAEAARRVGSHDIYTWLSDRRHEGHSVTRLAQDVGRSVPWVSDRLARVEPRVRRASHEPHVQTSLVL